MKNIHSFGLAILILLMASSSFAQTKERIYPRMQLNRTGTTMQISDLKVDVKVLGKMATTTFDFNFYNPERRILEGQFIFPLGEGQRVSRFAMDVNGKLREAVVVEKKKGQQVFESIVRKNIDPGLLEKTKRNNYKARVYPIPSKGYKRVVIAYEHELTTENGQLLYQLPLFFGTTIANFKLVVEVFKKKAELNQKNSLTNFQFKQWNENYKAEHEKQNYKAETLLSFTVPQPQETPDVFVDEAKLQAGRNAFYLNFTPEKEKRKKQLPKHITIVWDASFSMQKRNLEKELNILDLYFKKIGVVKVDLIPFSYRPIKKQTFKISKGNWSELKKALEAINYESASDFSTLDFSRFRTDEVLFFTDGLHTLNDLEFPLGKAPVIPISSKTQTNYICLKYIAAKTGGTYLNVTSMSKEQVMEALTEQTFQFISAEFEKGALAETYPAVAQTIQSDFSYVGILKRPKVKLKLNFGFGSTVTYSKTVEINTGNLSESKGLVEKMWAYKKLADLELQSEKNKSAIKELAQDYTIVTGNTSLIVLDRIEDYLEHRIVPPDELKKEYFERIEKQVAEKKKSKDEILQRSIAAYQKRIEWWEREVNFDMDKWKREKAHMDAQRNSRRRAQLDSSVLPPALHEDMIIEEDEVEVEIVEVEEEVEQEQVFMVVEENESSQRLRNKRKPSKRITKASKIKLAAWNPKTPYIDSLKSLKKGHFALYLSMRKDYETTPAYFLDVAEFFYARGEKETALSILLNVAELDLENHRLLRILARKLLQWGYKVLAVQFFEEVLRMRPQEPQSYRDLGLAYERAGKYQQAVDTLYQIAERNWERFTAIVPTAMMEMNAIIARHKVNTSQFDLKLLKNLPVDVRVVLNWDTDNSDMDLWVTDPIKEKCYYSHKETKMGGLFPHDHTGGYGPEEFMLKKAADGKYVVEVNYYGTSQQGLIGPTTIQLELITNFGTSKQKREEITLRLDTNKQVLNIGELLFGK